MNLEHTDHPAPTEPAARQGKIARLPHPIREELNRRIQNGEEGKEMAAWINSLPETQTVLSEKFDGRPINEQNLSNWRAGGYRAWEAKQQALEMAHTFCADEAELATAPNLSENLAFRTATRIALLLQDASPFNEEANRQLESLSLLCRQVVRLRRADHEAKWIELERDRLALEHQKFQEQSARANKSPAEPLFAATMEDFRLIEERDNM